MRAISSSKEKLRRVSLTLLAIVFSLSSFFAFSPTSPTAAATQWQTDGWDSISASNSHTCGLSNGHAYCWGYNGTNELGHPAAGINSELPVAIDMIDGLAGKTIKGIYPGTNSTCVIASDDLAYCWGDNRSGQLGTVDDANSNPPQAVYTGGALSGLTIKSMETFSGYTCAIASDDNLYCWGDITGSMATISASTDLAKRLPASMMTGGLAGKSVLQVAMSSNHTCALANDARVYCWGQNTDGQLGIGVSGQHLTPTAVDTSGVMSGKNIESITGTCALATTHEVYCWGLWPGNGTTNSPVVTYSPVAITTSGVLAGKTITGIADRCVLTSEGKAYCWGYSIGNGVEDPSFAPTAVDMSGELSGLTVQSLYKGTDGARCVIASNEGAYCWGNNNNGQLGNGTHQQTLTPSAVVAELPAPVINSVSFTTDSGKRLLVADGINYPEFSNGTLSTLVKLNGTFLQMCTAGGMNAQDFADAFGVDVSQISDTAPCYQLINDTFDGQLYTATQIRLWVPDGFDEAAEGTIQLIGGEVFTFNESSTPSDPVITAEVDNTGLTSTPTVSKLPTFSGQAPAGSDVTVVVHSDPVTCTTVAVSGDTWSCTLATALPAGVHTVNITIDTPSDGTFNLGPYTVNVASDSTQPSGVSTSSSSNKSNRTQNEVAVTDAQDVSTPEDTTSTTNPVSTDTTTEPKDDNKDTVNEGASFPWGWIAVGAGAFIVLLLVLFGLRKKAGE